MATAHLNQPPKQSAVGAFQSSPKWWWAVAEEEIVKVGLVRVLPYDSVHLGYTCCATMFCAGQHDVVGVG